MRPRTASEPSWADLDSQALVGADGSGARPSPDLAVTAEDFCVVAADELVETILPALGLVAGAITDIDGAPKVGKTTLVLAAVRAITTGGQFLGDPCQPGAVVLLSEEGPATLREGLTRAGLHHSHDLYVVAGMAARRCPWPELMTQAVAFAQRVSATVLMVDTLHGLAGLDADAENDSGAALAAMAPLRSAADAGLAVLMLRHQRKSGGAVGESGRGSSAFAGAVDTIVAMSRPAGVTNPNVRRLTAVSRFEGVPPEQDITWRGGEFVALGVPAQHEAREVEVAILAAIPGTAADAVTAGQVADAIPRLSVRRAKERLEELFRRDRIGRLGSGVKGSPHSYYRPDQHLPAKFPATSTAGSQETPGLISQIPAGAVPQASAGKPGPRFHAAGAPPTGGTPRPQETSRGGLSGGQVEL